MSPIRGIGGFTLATMAFTLALAWPTATHAEGSAPLVQYMVDGAKIGEVLVQGRLAADKSAKSGWVVVVTAHNDTDHAETVPLETDVTRRIMNVMARVPPRPQTVWSNNESVTIPAHRAMTKRYELPVALAAQVAAEKRADARPAPATPRPIVSFSVAFQQQALSSARATTQDSMIH